MKGQLTSHAVAADQQVAARGGRAQPRPCIPALSLGALPGGADLPAAGVCQQAGGRLLAGEPDPAGQGEVEARRDPQHIALATVFQELAQLGAAAIHLVAADEVQRDPVREHPGADIDGQLPLGPELQVRRQPHEQGLHRVIEVARGIHCRAPISACPVRSRTYARCTVVIPFATLPTHPRYCRLTPAVARALLLLAGLIHRPDRKATAAPLPPGRLIQARHREPAHHPHRREGIPARPVEQPLSPLRRPVTHLLRDRPPVPLRQAADQRPHILARLQPRLRPHETRPSTPAAHHASRAASAAPILAAAAAFGFVVFTNA